MTSQGSPHARFQRALRTGNALVATAAAAELGQVDLADALALTLLYRDQEPQRFERAALRWHGRLCAQARMISPEEAELALAALLALRLRNPGPGARALAAVLDGLMLTEASGVIADWVARRRG
jgi:hypothetical protein